MDTFSFGVVLFELLTSLPPLDDSREEGADMVNVILYAFIFIIRSYFPREYRLMHYFEGPRG